jgi:hypothetical protein
MRITRAVIPTTLLFLGGAHSAMSQPPSEAPRHPPPPEAIAACKSLTSGAECSFTTDRGSVTGKCWAPEGKPLACKPSEPPPSGSTPPGKK